MALTENEVAELKAKKARWRSDPVLFIREALGVRLTKRQKEIARALLTSDQIAVKSGQKTGKTLLAACLSIWWAFTKRRGLVRILSPSEGQVKDGIWCEIQRIYDTAPMKLADDRPAQDPKTGWKLPNHAVIKCVITNTPESAAGRSGADQLYIIDEASGLEDQFFNAAMGNLIGGGTIFCISNPTRSAGFFFDLFHSRSAGWCLFTLDARDTPNCTGDGEPIAGLAGPDKIRKLIAELGEDHPEIDVRVRGEFPRQGSDVVFTAAMLEAAVVRHRADTVARGELMIGVDVARYGNDESVAVVRRGQRILDLRHVRGLDTMAVAQLAAALAREHQISRHEALTINVDATGIGSGVVDALRFAQTSRVEDLDLPPLVQVVEVQYSASAEDSDQYHAKRDELAFSAAEWLKAGGSLPADEELRRELLAVTYSFDSKMRRKIASKDSMKRILGHSPDRADAFCLSCYGAIDAAKPAEPSRYESLLSARGAEMAGDSRY